MPGGKWQKKADTSRKEEVAVCCQAGSEVKQSICLLDFLSTGKITLVYKWQPAPFE